MRRRAIPPKSHALVMMSTRKCSSIYYYCYSFCQYLLQAAGDSNIESSVIIKQMSRSRKLWLSRHCDRSAIPPSRVPFPRSGTPVFENTVSCAKKLRSRATAPFRYIKQETGRRQRQASSRIVCRIFGHITCFEKLYACTFRTCLFMGESAIVNGLCSNINTCHGGVAAVAFCI